MPDLIRHPEIKIKAARLEKTHRLFFDSCQTFTIFQIQERLA